ncbi:type II secretory pathway, component PulD [Singulisphaera acidiphila]|uniref:Type II secretory pathway, component PulD n=1 Tax=Singulisphaera acidiphila (strain ATCC BAA-1392 / DSM 18658 / VKM B-2454 / MOB10) TaxID=886293 RepID=L0DJ25_SINAD|nr:type II secretory pathway, component PulD [Singulisphaera acidiphila]AGA29272.1 type II secretory pathway, component PulD [Singulisphaera acidiphila DSM 18658]
MGRLRTLAILLTLGAWGGATDGAPPEDAARPVSSPRPAAPVPPVRYLEAGARLFNSGQYALATQYLTAAQSYRDQLSVSEKTVLDAYLKELSRVPADTAVAPAGATSPTPGGTAPATQPAPSTQPASTPGANPSNAKQEADWKLRSAREQIRLGDYDAATRLVNEVQVMNVRWGLFDDTPAKVADAIEKARPKVAASPATNQPRSLDLAREKVKQARALLANNQFEQAEALALDVKSWKMSFGIFEDNPEKVASAARALRRRDQLRASPPREQPSLGVYDVLVQEARHLMSTGQLDQAALKAQQAQRMNVVPPLTSDRAETVLHDVEMARARQTPAGNPSAIATATKPAAESQSSIVEHEANELLARGDSVAASAKFSEVERLRARESGAAPATDAAVQKVQAVVEETLPGLPDPTESNTALPTAAIPPATELTVPPAAEPTAESAPLGRGEQILSEARTLYGQGNYAAARQMADDAKTGKHGVDAQADDLIAQIALAEQGGALSMYESALDALRKGEQGRARALLTEVAASGGALDSGLMQKVQDLLAKLPGDDSGKATASDLPQPGHDAEALAAQKLNAEVGTKSAEARRYQETDPDKAIAIYETTLRSVKAKSSELPEAVTRTMVRRLEVAIELAKKDKAAFDVKMLDKNAKAEIEAKRLRIFEADKAKKTRMEELMAKATTAMAEGRYQEANKFATMAQEIDPNEVSATILAWKANVQRHYKKDLENKAAKEDAALDTLQMVDTAAIADPEVQMKGIKYAESFKDMTADRLRMNAKLEIKKDAKTIFIESKLKERVSLNMEAQPLAEAVAFLTNYTGLNIVLDQKALADVDITTATPISLVVSDIQLKNALKLMLNPLGLNYKVENEVLMITSPQTSIDSTYPKPYYVGDLIMAPPRGPANPLNPMGLLDNPSNPGANGVGAQQIPLANGASTASNSGPNSSAGDRPKADYGPLIQLITGTIAPNSWKINDVGGGDSSSGYGMGGGFGAGDGGGLDTTTPIGSITPFFLSISLIIRHTAEIHDQVADLLKQLRRLQDLQVSIEVRFITLSDSFFEQIGVDFDFDIHSKTVGKKSTFAIPNPAQSIFPINGSGGIAGGGTTTGGGGGTLGGGGGGSTLGGAGGGSTLGGGGGGSTLGGAGGGLGGQNGGGLGGSGGSTLGGGGGTGGGQATPGAYIVNPFRDYSLGNKTPLTVGLASGGIGNFSSDLSIPFQQDSAAQSAPTIGPVNSTAGATFGISFLSDLEVYLFLTAAQGDTRSNILQAPKVTTFNGAPAFINNTQTIYYISSLTPIVGPGSVAFLPQPTAFPNGVTLTVTPVVSADRRYVRMTLSPVFTVIEAFQTLSVPAAVGGSGLGGGGAAINATIQLPQFNLTTVNTTVTVPDGGTVLLGGVKRLNEQRQEFGVPVLSKTPMLNRLFRNIGIGRTTSSLMLMVTPRIIILEEEEERLGIPAMIN